MVLACSCPVSPTPSEWERSISFELENSDPNSYREHSPSHSQHGGIHPWSGAATYALTKYVAGIRPTSFGYRTWIVEPAYAGFGLDYVNATVPTPRGNLSVSWTAKDSVVTVEIRSPVRTTGRLALTKEWAFEDGFVPKDCDKVQDVVYEIIGGVYHITHRVEA